MSSLSTPATIAFVQTLLTATTRKQTAARAANPGLDTIMTDRNDRIREIAYFLWVDEGCPEGEAERHWSTAEAMHDSQPSERKRLEGEPPGQEPVRADPTTRRAAAE